MGSVLKSAGEPSSEKPEAAIGPNRVFRLLTDASLVQLNFLLCFVPYVKNTFNIICTNTNNGLRLQVR